LFLNGFRGAVDAHRGVRAADGGMVGDVVAMIYEDGLDRRVAFEYLDEFRAAVAAISDDACSVRHCIIIRYNE
jgi:hypothetical protein